ncbi:peptidase M16 inactive domain protein [Mycobacterium kansasii]|uniref:Peptidase M16 inactive domain protein n=1 Tax=Mycobacterium kansasii TaxID=1768 RepID=A0A1V3XRC3_MYCKA|nr:peptidase M16 inactive domain protein [Mycobacterium kansasii]
MRRTTLPGGLRVVTEYLPSVRSASVGLWIGVGSRDEGVTVAGAAHFLEHLLFKSTPTRTAVDIAQAMDAVGGELNAFTAKEHTCYYAHVLDADLALAMDLVSDVVLNGRCAADDVELERDVVLEEIAMRDDDPEDALADLFLSALFGNHPVGRPVIGTVQSVSAMTRAQLQSFHLRRYTPERMVVAVAGNVDHGEVVALVREHFGPRLVRGRRPVAPRKGAGRVNGMPGLTLAERDAEQTHVSLGIRTPGRGWQHRWALSVLHTALGGGLSSRLFQEIREAAGWPTRCAPRWTFSPTAAHCRCMRPACPNVSPR